jgi:hypothetical protein
MVKEVFSSHPEVFERDNSVVGKWASRIPCNGRAECASCHKAGATRVEQSDKEQEGSPLNGKMSIRSMTRQSL